MTTHRKAATARLRIVQVHSQIGNQERVKVVLTRGLGLGRIGSSVVLPDNPYTRGMIAKVAHIVSFEELAAEPGAARQEEHPVKAPEIAPLTEEKVAKPVAPPAPRVAPPAPYVAPPAPRVAPPAPHVAPPAPHVAPPAPRVAPPPPDVAPPAPRLAPPATQKVEAAVPEPAHRSGKVEPAAKPSKPVKAATPEKGDRHPKAEKVVKAGKHAKPAKPAKAAAPKKKADGPKAKAAHKPAAKRPAKKAKE
jgi:ribosomal protein L30